MARDHFIPASILGQFSSDTVGPLRDRRIAIQRPGQAAYTTSASKVGFVNNLYATTGSALPNVDDTWTGIEQRLPEALDVLEQSRAVTADLWLRVLVPYVACLFVRGREWQERFEKRIGGKVLRDAVMPGNTNGARLIELQRTLALVTCSRWVIVHSQSMRPILNNDLGLAATSDPRLRHPGWIVPLSKRIAVGLFPVDRRPVVTWRGSQWMAVVEHVYWPEKTQLGLNRAIANFATDFVVGPDLASVQRVARQVGSAPTPNEILDMWPYTGREKAHSEYQWHRLVSVTHRNEPPPAAASTTPIEGVLDVEAIAEGWNPPFVYTLTNPPRRVGLAYHGRSILMSLRDAASQ